MSQLSDLTTANVDQNWANNDLNLPKFSATPANVMSATYNCFYFIQTHRDRQKVIEMNYN